MELWERGVALNEAPDRFAPASLAAPVLEARPEDRGELTGGWKMVADQGGWDENRKRAAKDLLAATATLGDSLIAQGRLRDARCSHIVKMILAKKAVAVGFPNGAAGDPQIIPTYLFENRTYIKWGSSSIVGNNLNFVSVRIARLRRTEQLPEIQNEAKANTPAKVGRRPSTEIIEIINELNMDPGFGKLPRKSQAQLVIKRTSEKYPKRFPHGKGLHVSTVCKYLHQELGP
jgi:hypothetical protein